MKQSCKLVGAFISAALLAACGGNNGLSSSTPTSVTPSVRSQPAPGQYGSRHVGKDGVTEAVLYSFTGAPDGGTPYASLTNVNGTLYGTTVGGGLYGSGSGSCRYGGCGTIFQITTAGAYSQLHAFAGPPYDGGNPWDGLTDVNGALYGTTLIGGAGCRPGSGETCGTVFKVTTAGAYSLIYSFDVGYDGKDGEYPYGGLLNVNGTLYGTTSSGGVGTNAGTVFTITTSGTENVLYSFVYPTDYTPLDRLVRVGNNLYGTTQQGGASRLGAVFKITTSGTETLLHSFAGGSDGADPVAGLTRGIVGTALYGTTPAGGGANAGTVFRITTSGTETVLHQFSGGPGDGAGPHADLIRVGHAFYGTTQGGGTLGQGTVFKITPSGHYSVIYSFAGGTDGNTPFGGLVNVNGTLYGTTAGGGASGNGAIFSLTGF
jgi:uncharacterized repeat protein (TIGR03803 family)